VFVWLDGNQVEYVGVRGHQHKHVLQEDECVVDWHGEQDCGQESSEEEIAWLDESPSALFVDLEHNGVEGGLGLLDLHDLESLADDGHEEDWDHDGQDEDDVGDHGGDLSHLGGVIAINNLHGGEESQIEVAQHVESEVDVELVLGQEAADPGLVFGSLWSTKVESKDNDVADDNQDEQGADQEQ
jgi:hypothetical protein